MRGQDVLSQTEKFVRSVRHLKCFWCTSSDWSFAVCDLLIYFMTILFLCFTWSFKNGKATFEGHGGARSSAVIRGEELRSNLEPEYPSFVKSLVRSHVAGCFWMVSSVEIARIWTRLIILLGALHLFFLNTK